MIEMGEFREALIKLANFDKEWDAKHPRIKPSALTMAANYGRMDGFRLVADVLGFKDLYKLWDKEADELWKTALDLRYPDLKEELAEGASAPIDGGWK